MDVIEKSIFEIMPYHNNPRRNEDAVVAVDVIINRWETLTGGKAVLIDRE